MKMSSDDNEASSVVQKTDGMLKEVEDESRYIAQTLCETRHLSDPGSQIKLSPKSAAASFFTRAEPKLGTGSAGTRKPRFGLSNDLLPCDENPNLYLSPKLPQHTPITDIIRRSPPVIPPTLLKTSGSTISYLPVTSTAKLRVLLNLIGADTDQNGEGKPHVTVDRTRKQISLLDPNVEMEKLGTQYQGGIAAPKLFAFDEIFTDVDPPMNLYAAALTGILQAVVSGSDGCLLYFSDAGATGSNLLLVDHNSTEKVGMLSCAVSWLFRLIAEQTSRTGARFSVRISAVEVHDQDDTLRDLLATMVQASDTVTSTAPSTHLRDESITGDLQLNYSELRSPSVEKAAHYLDAALAARNKGAVANQAEKGENLVASAGSETPQEVCSAVIPASTSHLFLTLHVYQYRIEERGSGSGVSGGRSRLHIIDLGSGRGFSEGTQASSNTQAAASAEKSTVPSRNSLTSALLSLIAGQRNIPQSKSKLLRLLFDSVGSVSCQTCLLIEIPSSSLCYKETLQLLQFSQKVQRYHKRQHRIGLPIPAAASSEDSSSCDSFGLRRASRLRLPLGSRGYHVGAGLSKLRTGRRIAPSELEYTSSSEQSCDTVIYLGRRGSRSSQRDGGALDTSRASLNRATSSLAEEPNPDIHREQIEKPATTLGDGVDHTNNECFYAVKRKEPTLSKNTTTTDAKRITPRTNAHVWRRAAAKNAVEMLSTQEELWVDGPKAKFSPRKSATTSGLTTLGTRATTLPIKMADKETQSAETQHSHHTDGAGTVGCLPEQLDVARGRSNQRVHSCTNLQWRQQKRPDGLTEQLREEIHHQFCTAELPAETDSLERQIPILQSSSEAPTEPKDRFGNLRDALVSCNQSPQCKESKQVDVASGCAVDEIGVAANQLVVHGSTTATQSGNKHSNLDQPELLPYVPATLKHASNPFVRAWLYKHSGVVPQPTDSKKSSHPRLSTEYKTLVGQSSQATATVMSTDFMNRVQNSVQPELSRASIPVDSKNKTQQTEKEPAYRIVAPEIENQTFVKQASSNFARIAEWVKSVSMENCENTLVAQRRITPAHTGTLPQLYSAFPMNPHVQDICNMLLAKGDVPVPYDIGYDECRPRHMTPQVHYVASPWSTDFTNSGVPAQNICAGECCLVLEECESRRGQSVPPPHARNLGQSYTQNYMLTEVPQSRVVMQNLPVVMKTNALSEEFETFPNLSSVRCPDGSSNPHLATEHEMLTIQRLNDQRIPCKYLHSVNNFLTDWKPEQCDNFRNTSPSTSRSTKVPTQRQKHGPFLCAGIPYWHRKHFLPDIAKEMTWSPNGCPSPEHSGVLPRPRAHSFSSSADGFLPCYSCDMHRRNGSRACVPTKPLNGGCTENTDHSSRKPRDSGTKSSKNRLKFFTSPIFNKRKRHSVEKTGKHAKQEFTNPMIQPHAKVNVAHQCFSLPQHPGVCSTATRRFLSQSLDKSAKQTICGAILSTAAMDHKFGLETSRRKQMSDERAVTAHTSPKCNGNPGLIQCNASSCRNTFSAQSSSGHGSECSGNHTPFNEPTELQQQSPETHCHTRRQHQRHRQGNPNHSYHRRRHESLVNQPNAQQTDKCCRNYLTELGPSVTNDASKENTNNRLAATPENSTENNYLMDPTIYSRYPSKGTKLRFPVCVPDSIRSRKGGGHTSSGYESIIRDSEASSHGESTSGSSVCELGSKVGSIPASRSETVVEDRTNPRTRYSGTNPANQHENSKTTQVPKYPGTNQCESQITDGKLAEVRPCNNGFTAATQFDALHTQDGTLPDAPHERVAKPRKPTENNNRIGDNLLTASSSSSNSRRSRSAPPHSESTSEETTSSPISVRYVAPKNAQTTAPSLATSQSETGCSKLDDEEGASVDDDAVAKHASELDCGIHPGSWYQAKLHAFPEDKSCLRAEEMTRQILFEKIYSLLAQQEMLKLELVTAKEHLMADPSTWNFGLYVAEHMDPNEAGFLKALEQETDLLRLRVDACKSHIMMITCFDSSDDQPPS
ncbi:unnamed protein product [Dicrocoelium dendriticum]|nr:unnamed protein product [Dicrocoelium dendriticum]